MFSLELNLGKGPWVWAPRYKSVRAMEEIKDGEGGMKPRGISIREGSLYMTGIYGPQTCMNLVP